MTERTPSAPRRTATITPNNIGEWQIILRRAAFECDRLPELPGGDLLWNGAISPTFYRGGTAKRNIDVTLGLHLSSRRAHRRSVWFHRYCGRFDRDRKVSV